jgi:hypothetical protein
MNRLKEIISMRKEDRLKDVLVLLNIQKTIGKLMSAPVALAIMAFGVTLVFAPPVMATIAAPQELKIIASDGQKSDEFGYSVSVFGDTAIIGSYGDDSAQGSAYVFVRSGSVWSQQAKLTAPDAETGNNFGYSVSVQGDTAIVGAYGDDNEAGSAYVFTRSGSTWSYQQKLTATNAEGYDYFGYSVSIYGNTAIVGAMGKNFATGAAYVFDRAGGVWTQQSMLTASDAATNDYFGSAVSVYGDIAVVGAVGKNLETGAAYVFVRSGATWTIQAKLTAADAAESDWLGNSVSIYDETAIVGAVGKNLATGAAYVFVRSGTTWTQQAKLTASDAVESDWFGYSVSVSDSAAVVGATENNGSRGAAYVFVRSGTTWTQQLKQTASDAASLDNFGASVSIYADVAIVGAMRKNLAKGAAYIYMFPCGFGRDLPASAWLILGPPCSSPNSAQAQFGDNLPGAYGVNWILKKWLASINQYVALASTDPLTQGQGLWIKSYNAGRLDMNGTTTPLTTSAQCPSPAGCFEIALTPPAIGQAKRCNLLGHPFPYPVNWADVRIVVAGTAYTPSEAQTAGHVNKTFYRYNGNAYEPFDDVTPGMIGILKPFEGFWVETINSSLAPGSVKLLIPAKPSNSPQASLTAAENRLWASKETNKSLWSQFWDSVIPSAEAEEPTNNDSGWNARLTVEIVAKKLKDKTNVFGQLKDSQTGYDLHDLKELPPFGTPYLTIVFPHLDWGKNAGDYSSDFHPISNQYDQWTFEVRADAPTSQVSISWQCPEEILKRSRLIDLQNGKIIAVDVEGRYEFVMNGKVKKFRWERLTSKRHGDANDKRYNNNNVQR